MSKRARRRAANTHKTTKQTTAPLQSDDQPPASEVEAELQPEQAGAAPLVPSRQLAFWLVLALVALAFVLRGYRVADVPHGFFCDEASTGLEAYSLAHTLRDKGGQGSLLPFYIEGLGEWRGALYTYCAIPFITLFGLNEFGVRMTSVVMGTLTVWLTWLFVSRAVNRSVGLLAAFLLAISPWHILHSRIGWDLVSLPCLTALFLTFFYLGLERPGYLRLACACAAFGPDVYFSGRLFMPIFCLTVLAIYATPLWQQRRVMVSGLVIAALLLIPTILAVKDKVFFKRLQDVSGPPQTMAEMLGAFGHQYLQQYSPNFLLNTQTDGILRHFVRDWGLLYGVEVPFLLLGLGLMLWRRNRFDLLCLTWFVTYPIANALISPPNSTRAISGVIVYQIAIAQGIYGCLCFLQSFLEKRPTSRAYRTPALGLTGALIISLLLYDNALYMSNYLTEYPTYSSGFFGWQWGMKDILAYFRAHNTEYDHMYIDAEFNAPYELYKFFAWPDGPNNGPYANCDLTAAWVWWLPQEDRDAAFSSAYNPAARQLWAVGQQGLELIQKRQIPYRVVAQSRYPDDSPAFYFVATGPGPR